MKTVTQLKSLGDMRTIISTHTRSVPRHKGSGYLDILSLGMEKLRLETEQEWLSRREGRIRQRLGEVGEIMHRRLNEVRPSGPPAARPAPGDAGQRPDGRELSRGGRRTMTVGY